MKADPDVKMISAEAPILFAKGCDIFITELTMRAWIHAEENKRRTLQRSDIASALAKSDMFDFLIDIVPREEAASHAKRAGQVAGGATSGGAAQTSSAGGLIPPSSNVQQQPPPTHTQQSQSQHMGHTDYHPLGNSHQIGQEQDFRPPPAIYAPQVQQDPTAYGQAQQPMFDGMYGYAPMAAPQQVNFPPPCVGFASCGSSLTSLEQMYQVNQRSQDPAGGQNPSHQYPRHDGGEGDADAEGERDYEVS